MFELKDALKSAHDAMVTLPHDMSVNSQFAWIYGIIVGWESAIHEVAAKHDWKPADVERLKRLRSAVKKATQ